MIRKESVATKLVYENKQGKERTLSNVQCFDDESCIAVIMPKGRIKSIPYHRIYEIDWDEAESKKILETIKEITEKKDETTKDRRGVEVA